MKEKEKTLEEELREVDRLKVYLGGKLERIC